MSTFKIQMHPRKSFFFLGRIALNSDVSQMEIDSEDLADVELRQIIGSVMSYNLECDKSLGELVDLFKDADMKTEFSMGLRAQGKNLAEVNAKYVAVDVTVKPDAPTLEELKEDYKVKYSHLLDLLTQDEVVVLGYLRDMQLNRESGSYSPVEIDVLDWLSQSEKSNAGRKGVVKGIFSIIASFAAEDRNGLVVRKEVKQEQPEQQEEQPEQQEEQPRTRKQRQNKE